MSDKLRGELFWTDRWISSSAFLLPLEARGLYREMLTRAWSFGGYLPADPKQIQRLVNASSEEWERCWPLIEANWKQDGSKLYNQTQREVLMESLTIREKRALAGRKGGKASGKARSKPEANAEATPQANPKQTKQPSLEPSLSLEQEQSPNAENDNGLVRSARRKRTTYPADFEAFWLAYPSKVGKAAAFRSWKTHHGKDHAEEIIGAIQTQRRGKKWRVGFIPNPATWLNQHRWEDEPDEVVRAPRAGQPQNGREQQLREMAQSQDEKRRAHALAALRAEGFDR